MESRSSSCHGTDPLQLPKKLCQSPGQASSSQLQEQSTEPASLPDEVLIAIFSYLSLEDIALCVRPVCPRWQELSDSEYLTKLHFEDNGRSTRTILQIIRAAPNLLSLELEDRYDVERILEGMVGLCENMTQLTIKYCSHCELNEPGEERQPVIRGFPKITDLTINRTEFGVNFLFWEMCGSLRTANFRDNIWFDAGALDDLLRHCPQLEELRAEQCMDDWQDQDMAAVAKYWGSSLRVLKLFAPDLTDCSMESLAACTQLKNLCLTKLKVTVNGLLHLNSLTNLVTLGLAGTSLTAEDWCRFFTEWSRAGQLHKLVLNCCSGVDESVLTAVATSCPNLVKLHLWECLNVTDVALTAVLRGCPRLLYLNIDCTDLSVSKCFPIIPKLAPQLRTLIFYPFEDEELELVANLKAALPYLDIHD